MASNGNDRGRFLTVGGILSIVVGVLMIYVGVLSFIYGSYFGMQPHLYFPLLYDFYTLLYVVFDLDLFPRLMIRGGLFLALGILAVVGGISAIRRKSFGLSLAGAICALPSGILGILAVVFVSPARKEFRAED